MVSQEVIRPAAGFIQGGRASASPADDAGGRGDAGGEEGGGGGTLEETARREQEYLRDRLREELGREPTEGELSEWLRQHTEGY